MSNTIDTIESIGTDLESKGAAPVCRGYIALGMKGASCVVFAHATMKICEISPSGMKEMDLGAKLGYDWCKEAYPNRDPKREAGFNHRKLAFDILKSCQALGEYTDSKERKVGVWRMVDGGLVVNGRTLWRPDGTVLPHGVHEGHVYSRTGDVGFDSSTVAADEPMVQRVLETFRGLSYARPLAAELMLGWLAVAFMPTAFNTRPAVMLTGPAGVGKTTVLELLKNLLGPRAFSSAGKQTEAGIRQTLSDNSKAFLADECEAEEHCNSFAHVMSAARASYSLQEGQTSATRGTPEGTTKNFSFYSPFFIAAISPGLLQPADLTRWVQVEATGRQPDAKRLSRAEAEEIGPRLGKLVLERWSVLQASQEVFHACIVKSGGSSRLADTVGTLLSCYWSFISTVPVEESEAEMYVELLDLHREVEVHSERDEIRCLEALFTKVVPFRVTEGEFLVTKHLSLSEAVKRVCEDPTDCPDVVARLAQLGVRVVRRDGQWKLYVANSPVHQELRKVFSGTKWANGGWSTVLRRLPGGCEDTQRLGAGFRASKVTVFDVPADLTPANDEVMDALAA